MVLTRIYDFFKRFDDSDAESPLHYKYVRLNGFLMSTIGSWPHRQFGRPRLDKLVSLFNLLLIAVGFGLCYGNAAYLHRNKDTLSFFDFGHTALCFVLEILFLQRLMMARIDKYREIMRCYLLEFHLFYIKHRSQYAAKIHAQVHIISIMITAYVMYILVVGNILFAFMPWYNNYRRGMFSDQPPPNVTFEHAVYYYYFTDDPYTTLKGYWILFAFNIPTAYTTTIGLCVFDLILSLMVLQTWGHLKILKYNLLHMPLPADNEMYSDEENQKIRLLLRESIEHHKTILTFVDKCSDTYSEYLFLFYLAMQFITCILLLELSSLTPDALAKYGPLSASIYQQLIQVSILFEMLDTKSRELIDAVYATPWDYMNTSNRRTLMYFLQKIQTPVNLKAAKVVPVGIMTMASVLKTTLSYYVMLRTIAGER